MKYHIDTIPVWDAYDQKDECPLCVLEYDSEIKYVDYFLSGSVMEPDIRIEVNKIGFCQNHFKLLYNKQNHLGLALITHTHLKETIGVLDKLTHTKDEDKKTGLMSSLKGLLSSQKNLDDFPAPLLSWLNEHHTSCMVCRQIETHLNRYAYTIIHLWKNDSKFIETLRESKGFCLNHFALIIEIANKSLNSKTFNNWIDFILPIEKKALSELETDLEWFTKKFDYRNKDKPWGNSRKALPKSIQKLSGAYMEAPPKRE